MKHTKIKAWPELVDFLPCLSAFRDANSKVISTMAGLEVDFGSVSAVSSTGLTVFLLRLLRILGDRGTVHIRNDYSPPILDKLAKLGAFKLLGVMAGSLQHELPLEETHSEVEPILWDESICLPIYRIDFHGCVDRRRAVSQYVSWLIERLIPISETHKLAPNGLVMLLNEIAKNAADHGAKAALFGMDTVTVDKKHSRLSFAFGDLGVGIKQHIGDNLPPEAEARRNHMSLYEAYRLALKPGYTSNRSSTLNKGHGMSIITDCAVDLRINLSIFDASSRGLLSSLERVEIPSHAAIRRIFHNIGHDVGFFYYGDLVIKRK